jgi:multiple sugar transport system ATP-binding protein
MDEPLANLDALLRLEMRVELKRLQAELGQTLVYVTHDQVEAMSMADRIAVLNHGVLQQCDPPDVIYNLPANRFVATVVGSPPTNFIPAEVRPQDDRLVIWHPTFTLSAGGSRHPLRLALESRGELTAPLLVAVRPEDVRVAISSSGAYSVPAQVSVIEPLGGETIVDLRLGPDLIKAVVPPTQRLEESRPVWLAFEASRIHLFDSASGARLYTTRQPEDLVCRGHENP